MSERAGDQAAIMAPAITIRIVTMKPPGSSFALPVASARRRL